MTEPSFFGAFAPRATASSASCTRNLGSGLTPGAFGEPGVVGVGVGEQDRLDVGKGAADRLDPLDQSVPVLRGSASTTSTRPPSSRR